MPADFNKDTVDEYVRLNEKYEDSNIYEAYGNIPVSFIGSGRHIKNIRKINLTGLSRYIKRLHADRIQFNYTLNASCCGGTELSPARARQILGFIGSLIDVGTDRFTVAVPSLIDLIKYNYKDVKITASVIAQVDSVDKLSTFKRLGCDRINIDENMNRDFAFIRAASRLIDIEAIVNFVCTSNCPFEYYHYNTDAHGTAQCRGSSLQATDYILLRCYIEQVKNPVNRIKAGWIRPEDLGVYVDAGVKFFKIIGRKPAGYDLLRTAETYMKGKYSGNLQRLFERFPKATIYSKVFNIDNEKLDGFIDYFLKEHPNCKHGCMGCDHCYRYARKALKVNRKLADKLLKECERALESSLSFKSKR